jgi:hypothetical protein
MDLCFSNNSTPCMLQNVTVPLHAAAHQATFKNLIEDVKINCLNSKSADKDFKKSPSRLVLRRAFGAFVSIDARGG